MKISAQHLINTSDSVSQDLIDLLGARGYPAVKAVFEKAKRRVQLEDLMRRADRMNFIEIGPNPNKDNNVPYQSIDKALKELDHFMVESDYYGKLERKQQKLLILLDSVLHLEADALHKLVTKNYDVKAVHRYLFPEESKPRGKKAPDGVTE